VDRFELFSTPVRVFRIEDAGELNREIAQRFVAESESSPGIHRSNTGGWHSIPDLTLRPDDCYQQLAQMIVQHVEIAFRDVAAQKQLPVEMPYRFGMHGWAMVMRDGDYTIVHAHSQAHWSIAYYPDAGDADLDAHPDSGRLSFVDPRRGTAAISGIDLFAGQFSVMPETGMLVVFPGTVQHYVHTYRGTRPRVCISCNLVMEPAPQHH
jgi:uncharacterized protein (TIGR02466 family)